MDLAREQPKDVSQLEKKDEKRIVRLLESCTKAEVCRALGGNDKLLTELRNKLRDWLTLQPHLPQDIPEERLEYFVISTKLSLKRAKQKLDMYYTVRRLVPEFFAKRDPRGPDFAQLQKTLQWVRVPKLTPEKYRVYILRFMEESVFEFQLGHFSRITDNLGIHFRHAFMVNDVRISECRCLGDIYLYDLSGFRLGHLTKPTPSMIKKMRSGSDGYGSRIKGLHFFNAPTSFVDRIVALVKSSLKPKLASRIHVHSMNSDSMYDFVPKSILPADYGGHQPTMDQLSRSWGDKLNEWRDWFIAEEKVYVDEKLRYGPTVDGDELFGFSGSFRKLEVD